MNPGSIAKRTFKYLHRLTNSALVTLNLGGSSMGDNGAKALTEALKTNSTMTTSNLNLNSTGYGGAKELAEALKTNSTLATLNLE
ncbi:hypothetical protein BGZ72_001652, partial [Mortierella alpina]